VNFSYTVIIPARYASTRLPGKPLLDIQGKPLLQHVYEAARGSMAGQVLIATDDERIEKSAGGFQAEVIRTSPHHVSGTDRIAEAVTLLSLPDDAVVVNVQGDEFGLPAALIDQVAVALNNHPEVSMATLCEKINSHEDLNNPNVVKLVLDRDNHAIYFSRAAIPWSDNAAVAVSCQPMRHIGIYAYRAGFLQEFTSLPASPLEQCERLEQLRALYYGYSIFAEEAAAPCGTGIDTQADLERVRALACL
jgi:3-deoxy-manno-octulosonate cytidylyltransferase (CMP-KDO synthetase)